MCKYTISSVLVQYANYKNELVPLGRVELPSVRLKVCDNTFILQWVLVGIGGFEPPSYGLRIRHNKPLYDMPIEDGAVEWN